MLLDAQWRVGAEVKELRPLGAMIPLVWRRMRIRRGERVMTAQVRALLDDLRLGLALDVAIGH